MRSGAISASGTNTLVSTVAYDIPDDILLTLGTSSDIAMVLSTGAITANATLTGVIEGTTYHMATAVNSLLISNVTNNGDIQFLVSDDGASWGMLTFNADDHSAHFGQNDYGVPVTFYGATSNYYLKWDEANDDLILAGTNATFSIDATVDATNTTSGSFHTDGGVGIAKKLFVGTNLDVDGTTQLDGTLTVGIAGVGHDVLFYSDVSGSHVVWDSTTDMALEFTNSKIEILTTDDKTAGFNAIYSYIDTGGTTGWTSGNVVAGRFKVNVDHTAGTVSDLTAGWFGLNMAAGYAATQTGLRVAVNIEGGSAVANAPTSLLYLQSLPSASADFSDMPYMVFSETRGGAIGTGSRYLFEVGSAPASTVPTIGTGELFYQNTLQIAVNQTGGNRTAFYIPLSTAEASYTTAYPIILGSTGTRTALTYNGVKSLSGFTTCASTDGGGSYEPQRFDNVLTGAGQVGGRFRINMSTDVQLGSWANAFKVQADLNATGGATGLLAVGTFEATLPTGAGTGTVACLELEMTCPDDGFTGQAQYMPFIFFNTTGTTKEGFNDYGALFELDAGLVAATGNLVGANYSTLRITFNQWNTTRYIPLSTAEASFTSAYPIALTNTLTVGVSDTGHDVKFWGATAAHYMLWDESADELVIKGRINFLEDTSRTGEGTYLFANGLHTGMATPGDTQGIKMEFDYGVNPTLSGDGKNVHGLDIKFTMDKEWKFTSADRNATIRGARIQGWSQDNVGGKVAGIYSCARAEGTSKTITGRIGAGADDGPGLVSLEARTELGDSASITVPAVVGLEVFHNSKTGSSLVGDYRAINIQQPLMPTITGTMYGLWFGDDQNTGYPYDYALGFSSELDLDQIAHHNAGFTTTGSGAVDGFVKIEIDGNPLYLYAWVTKPS